MWKSQLTPSDSVLLKLKFFVLISLFVQNRRVIHGWQPVNVVFFFGNKKKVFFFTYNRKIFWQCAFFSLIWYWNINKNATRRSVCHLKLRSSLFHKQTQRKKKQYLKWQQLKRNKICLIFNIRIIVMVNPYCILNACCYYISVFFSCSR